MRLKEKLSKWKLRSVDDKKRSNKRFVNINDAVNVGVILSYNDKEIFEILKEELNKRAINIVAITFSNNKNELTFGAKDFSLFGSPKTNLVNEFIETEFDILIDISTLENIYIQIIRALSKAKFRVSCLKTHDKYLDFNIEIKKSLNKAIVIQQMIYYLEVINKTKHDTTTF